MKAGSDAIGVFSEVQVCICAHTSSSASAAGGTSLSSDVLQQETRLHPPFFHLH